LQEPSAVLPLQDLALSLNLSARVLFILRGLQLAILYRLKFFLFRLDADFDDGDFLLLLRVDILLHLLERCLFLGFDCCDFICMLIGFQSFDHDVVVSLDFSKFLKLLRCHFFKASLNFSLKMINQLVHEQVGLCAQKRNFVTIFQNWSS